MKAGRELDALIHERVFDKNAIGRLNDYYTMSNLTSNLLLVPHYSTNISDAWLVVEKFDFFEFTKIEEMAIDGTYRAKVEGVPSMYAETAPLAIFLAALRTVGVDIY